MLTGCYLSHARENGDGGAPSDGCGLEPAVVALTCPASVVFPSNATVHVEARTPSCCPATAASFSVHDTGPRAKSIAVQWDACQCCGHCRCSGSMAAQDLDLGILDEGDWTITAGSASCTISVLPHSIPCIPQEADEAIAPLAMFGGEPIPVLLRAANGCGCRPHAQEWELGLCACGTTPCANVGYEATLETIAPPILGAYTLPVAEMPTVQIAPPDACDVPPTIESIRVIAPDGIHIDDDPHRTWVEITGTELRCCGQPMPAIHAVLGTAGQIPLEVCETALDPCDCEPGTLTHFTTHVPLPDAPPGDYIVSSGGASLGVTLP